MLKLRGLGGVGILAGLAALGLPKADAQTVSITPITLTDASSPVFNLTTLGPNGWVKWGSTNLNNNFVDADSGAAPFTTMSIGGGANRFDNSSFGNNFQAFTWTNGNQDNNSEVTGVVYYDPGAGGDSTQSGFNVSVPTVGPTGSMQFFVLNNGDAAQLTANLQGSSGTLSSQTDNSFNDPLDPIAGQVLETGYYTVKYSGATAGDSLQLRFVATADYGAGTGVGEGWVGIQAAALQGSAAVPEPTVLGLFGIALAGCMIRRRSK